MSSTVPLMASLAEHQLASVQAREEAAAGSGKIKLHKVPAGTTTTKVTSSFSSSLELGRKVLEDSRVFTAAEVRAHRSEKDAWIVVDGAVYDITRFLETHPGGVETIVERLHEQEVGKLMRGEQADQFPDSHPHSKYAFRMLQQFLIGRLGDSQGGEDEAQAGSGSDQGLRYGVDLSKPLVFQVGQLGADYDKWVHDPIVQREPPRFFQSDIAEFFTQTAWWVIPVVWFPWVLYTSMLAFQKGLRPSAAPFTMALGAFLWTLIEYLLHRYLFHMKTSGYWTNTLHYFLHGFHHKHPMDGTRLVFPPAITAIIVTLIWFATDPLVMILGRAAKLSVFSGGLLMYIAYDVTHYFLHFGTAFSDTSRMMKRLHLNHHFKDQSSTYGITTTLWDRAFGTLPPTTLPATKSIIAQST